MPDKKIAELRLLTKRLFVTGIIGTPAFLLASVLFGDKLHGVPNIILILGLLVLATACFVLLAVSLGLVIYIKRYHDSENLDIRRDIAFGLMIGGACSLPAYITLTILLSGVLRNVAANDALRYDIPFSPVNIFGLLYIFLGWSCLLAFVVLPIIGFTSLMLSGKRITKA